MRLKNKKSILALSIILLFSMSIIGCTKKSTNPPPSGTTTQKGINPDGTLKNDTTNNMTRNQGLQDSTIRNDMNTNLNTRAEKIESAVNRISGVRSSRVIISNNRALVGVDMVSNIEGTMTNDLKANIEKTVKSADNQLTSVAVTADPDIFNRITNVGNGIRSGRPLSEFGNEIEELFRRILPR